MACLVIMGAGLALCAVSTEIPLPSHAKPRTETQKIESLIKHVEELDAMFIRNGTEYDAKTAAQFLRGKWNAKKAEIKTATDFIDKVASVSSTTGKPYLIRFKNGRQMKSREYMLAQLKKADQQREEKRIP